jgi:ubiquitin C-terminal hydrolase
MGKGKKKKRRRERLRREQELSTFGALKVSSSKQYAPLTPFNNMIQSSSKQTNPRNAATLPFPTHEEPNVPSANKIDSFGSMASRIRKLPTVLFVYAKQSDDHSPPVPFEFGTVSAYTPTQVDAPLNVVHTEQITTVAKQSIDDILYPKPVVESALHSQDVESAGKSGTSIDRTPGTNPSLQILPVIHEQKAVIVPREERVHRQPYLSGVSVEEAVKDKIGLRPRANSTDGELKLPQRGLCDERTVLESYKWRGNLGQGTPMGFHNLGNTCFLNSTLQCLAHCPPFCQSLINMLHVDESPPTLAPILENQHSSGKMSRGRLLTLTLADLFRRVHHPSNRLHEAIAPRRIVDALPHLGSGSSRRNGYKFRPGRQEDAHEFLVHLLDAMNDGELRAAGINSNQSGWRDRLPVPRLDETTFIHRIFGGYLRSQVRCTDCGYRSNTYDPFLDLSLEISRSSCNSVISAFHEFTRKETLDMDNRWKCSGCKKRVCATKQLTVFRPPLALCIQLKRFAYGGGFSLGGKKISRPIEFPVKLQLPLSDGRSCAYALTGLVIHVGGSASSGHYTAYVRKPCDSGDRAWFHMDDSFVQQVSEQHVLRQRDAYVVMYCRQEVKVEFPTPPLSGSMTAEEAKEWMISRNKARSEDSFNTPVTLVTETQSSVSLQKAISSIPSEKSDEGTVVKNEVSLEVKASVGIEISLPPPFSINDGESNEKSSDSDSSGSSESDVGEAKSSSLDITSPRKFGPLAPSITSKDVATESQNKMGSLNSDRGISSANLSAVSSSTETKKLVQSKVLHKPVDGYENGKIEVVMDSGLKSKKAWLPKTGDGRQRCNYDLLGNIHVSKWEDDDQPGETDGILPNSSAEATRRTIAKALEKEEQDRKRKMFVDRHDALLDQGKVSFSAHKNTIQ